MRLVNAFLHLNFLSTVAHTNSVVPLAFVPLWTPRMRGLTQRQQFSSQLLGSRQVNTLLPVHQVNAAIGVCLIWLMAQTYLLTIVFNLDSLPRRSIQPSRRYGEEICPSRYSHLVQVRGIPAGYRAGTRTRTRHGYGF